MIRIADGLAKSPLHDVKQRNCGLKPRAVGRRLRPGSQQSALIDGVENRKRVADSAQRRTAIALAFEFVAIGM